MAGVRERNVAGPRRLAYATLGRCPGRPNSSPPRRSSGSWTSGGSSGSCPCPTTTASSSTSRTRSSSRSPASPSSTTRCAGGSSWAPAFTAFVAETTAWLRRRHASPEDVTRIIVPGHGFEELIVHVDGPAGRVALPIATRTERREDERIEEIRVYHSNLPLTGRHGTRPPLLQPDPGLELPGPVAAHQDALAAADAEAAVAAFAPDGYVRGPDDAGDVHRGPDALRAFYAGLLAGGGIAHENCTLTGDGTTLALEYNVVRQGGTALLPQAGVAMYVLDPDGRLAAVRVYDDVEPPPA